MPISIDGRTDGHAYGRLGGHTDIRREPNCMVIS